MNPKDREYESLKKEIEQRVSVIYTNIKVLYVTLTVVLAWAITQESPLMCLLGYCIIIPSYNIVMDYYIGILRIGAYINVFLEEYPWENRLHKVNTLHKDGINTVGKKIKRYETAYNTPHILSSIMCLSLTAILTDYNCLNVKSIIVLIFSLIIFIALILYIGRQRSNDDIKQQYINEFEEIKKQEQVIQQHNQSQENLTS